MSEVAERLGQPPGAGRGGQLGLVDVGDDLVGGAGVAPFQRPLHPPYALGDERLIGTHVAADVGKRPAVAAQAQAGVERIEFRKRGEELAGGVGRPAVVVVERDAAEQVVAGEQQAPLALVEANVRRRMPRGLEDVPPPVVVSKVTPPTASRSGSTHPATPEPWLLRRSSKARSGSAGTPLWRATSMRRCSAASGSSA